MKKTILISAIILALALVASSIIFRMPSATTTVSDNNFIPDETTQPIACTMDAKACADGSFVGRQGPRCEFAACPGEEGGSSVGEEENTTSLVTPPADGIFTKDAVQNFTSQYIASTRTWNFSANVLKTFFFEANAVVALYDQNGNLLEKKGAMYTGQADIYTTPLEYLPFMFSFVLPMGESPDQKFVVRIIQDNPSGNTPLYWGTVVQNGK